MPFKEFISGWGDYGDFTFGFVYNESNYNILQGFQGVSKYWRIVLNGSSKVEVQGFINALTLEAPQGDEAIMGNATVRCTGVATFTVV